MLFFENFKMLLHDGAGLGMIFPGCAFTAVYALRHVADCHCAADIVATAENGSSLPLMRVMSETLKFIKSEALKEASKAWHVPVLSNMVCAMCCGCVGSLSRDDAYTRCRFAGSSLCRQCGEMWQRPSCAKLLTMLGAQWLCCMPLVC